MSTKKNDAPITQEVRKAEPVDKTKEVRGCEPHGQEVFPPAESEVEPQQGSGQRPELLSLAVLADRHRVPAWQAAALVRLMSWKDGKRVTDGDYQEALQLLSGRRLGGGRL